MRIERQFGMNDCVVSDLLPWPQRELGHGHGATQTKDTLTEHTLTNMSEMVCKHCGVGKISRHYVLSQVSLPNPPLFVFASV